MIRASRRKVTVAAVVSVATLLIASACSSSPTSSGSSGTESATVSGGSSSSGTTGGSAAAPHGLVEGDVDTINSGTATTGGTVTYANTVPISNWNVLNSGGSTYSVLDISGAFWPYAFNTLPSGKLVQNEDIISSATVVKTDPQTVEYKINPDAVWSDGTPISADDFIYTWKALDPAQCPDCQMANSAGYDSISSVEGSDGGKTVTVTFKTPYVTWQMLFSPFLPSHIAAKYGDVTTKDGLAKSFNDGFVKNVPDWSAGPFIIKEFTSDGSVVMAQNPKWFGASKPKLTTLIFRLVSDPTQQAAALANHEVDVLNPPNIDTDVVKQLADIPDVSYQIAPSFASHFMFLNMNAAPFKDKALRQAIFEAVNTQNIATKILGPYVNNPKPLTSEFFLPDQDGYQDSVGKYSYGVGDIAAATKTLQDAGYTGIGSKLQAGNGTAVPALTFAVSAGNQVRQNEAELVQAALAPLGITVNIVSTPNLLDTVQKGDWDLTVGTNSQSPAVATVQIALFGSCPAGVIFCRFNISNFGSPEVDSLIEQAIAAPNNDESVKLLQKADDIVASSYAVLPLYQIRNLTAYNSDLANIRGNGVQWPAYNSQDWGWKTAGHK